MHVYPVVLPQVLSGDATRALGRYWIAGIGSAADELIRRKMVNSAGVNIMSIAGVS